jgi:ferric enterobactin receptor
VKAFYVLIFCLIVSVLHSQDVRQTPIFEEFENTPLTKVIKTLKKKYKIKFAFDDALVTGLTISGSFQNVTVSDFLDEILPVNGINYQVLNNKYILVPKAIEVDTASPTLFNFTLSGIVTDRMTGETLPNALVRVKGSSQGTVTNKDGRFLLPNVPSDTAKIEITYLGYKVNSPKLAPGADRKAFKVEMQEETTMIKGITVRSIPSETIKIGEGVGQSSINPRNLANLPSLGELDIFRSLQLLPGISGTDETSSGLNIRGSEPSHNLMLFDGFTLYKLDHFFGLFSAINADAVKDIQVFKSGFVPKYGGRIAGVVDITGKSGSKLKPEFSIGLNMLSARFSAQAPILNKKGSVILSARRSYTDFIQTNLYKDLFGLVRENSSEIEQLRFEDQNDDIVPNFYFYDINAKISYQPSNQDLFSLTFYTGTDRLSNQDERSFEDNNNNIHISDILDEEANWGNNGISFGWSRQWNRKYYSRITLSNSNFFEDYYYDYQFDLNSIGRNERFDYTSSKYNNIRESQLIFENEVYVNRENRVDFGLNVNKIEMNYELIKKEDSEETVVYDDGGTIYGLYFNEKYTPNEKVTIEAGLRYTVTGLVLNNFLSPRLSLQYKPNPIFGIKLSAGRYQQLIHEVLEDDPFTGKSSYWSLADDINLPALKSNNFTAGFNISDNGWNLDVEYFNKYVEGTSIFTVSQLIENGQRELELTFAEGTSEISGIDVLLQKDTRQYSGWMAYTLLHAVNQYDSLNMGQEIRSPQDQRHEFKFVNMLKLRKFNFSATWIYGSGKPYWQPNITFSRNNQGLIRNIEIDNNDKIVYDLPSYSRLDISGAYKFGSERFNAEVGFSILNLLDTKNVRGKRLDIGIVENSRGRPNAPKISDLFRDQQLLGFTPSLFFNINF